MQMLAYINVIDTLIVCMELISTLFAVY